MEKMHRDLTKGKITLNMLLFALPLMLGNLLQQLYNIADTFVVGRFLGKDALAAVGSSYSLMTFLTSIIIGLCMGSGIYIANKFGKKDGEAMRKGVFISFVFIALITVLINIAVYVFIDQTIWFLRVPEGIKDMMKEYLVYIYLGIIATFIYNYLANLLRAVGNSLIPLIFLALAALLNVILDLVFVIVFKMGVKGAAIATTIAQYVSAFCIIFYVVLKFSDLLPKRKEWSFESREFKKIFSLSILTSLQQSIMNFGILMVQGLVNSFGTIVMSAFAAGVKIDSFAYMPVQDFGNAFSTFVAQNYGADEKERIKKGVVSAFITSSLFCLFISSLVVIFAKELMTIFIYPSESSVIAIGMDYLRIEGSFYILIGVLFLLYGYFRAINRPMVSIVLTITSLGMRVILAYLLSAMPLFGVNGIWMAVPIGWLLADILGIALYLYSSKKVLL